MRTITVNKDELLIKLRANRENHVAEYEEAKANYRDKVVAALKERAMDIQKGGDVNIRFDLPEPRSFADQYDDAIAMLEWHQDDEIDLDHGEFQQFVQNQWHWSQQFAGVTQQYLGR